MAEVSAFKYRVFLSCSRHDKSWATWLQNALERYRLDPEVVGRETPIGPVPKTLRPIFRNRDELAPDDALTEQTLAALQASQFLVVICSPRAANSRHVDEEIRRFKALGRADQIIPVIVDGVPGDSERECFPPALRFRVAIERRRPSLVRREPFVTDARLNRDGRELAVQKVVAKLVGVGLHEINLQARTARQRQLRLRRNGAIAALLALTLAYDGGLALARHELAGDEALLDRTLVRVTTLMGKAVALSKQLALSEGVSAALLQEAEHKVRAIAGLGRDSAQLRLRKAAMLVELARGYAAFGQDELQRARAGEAAALLTSLAAEAPTDLVWQRELALAHDDLGDVLEAQGRLDEALASYRASRALALRLAAASPDDDGRQRELAIATAKIGNVQLVQGLTDDALVNYSISGAILERLAAADRTNIRWQHDLLLSHQRIGDVLRVQGEHDAALVNYRRSRVLAERIIAGAPGHAGAQHALAAALVRIGDALARLDKPDEALASFRAAYALAERFAAAEPASLHWHGELGLGHERVGSVLEGRGDLAAALIEYRASLAIAHRLAAAEPLSAARQRDLGIAHEHIGDVLRESGDIKGALAAYEAKKTIVARLAAADPANVGWQYELGTSHARIASTLEARDDFAAATGEYEACLAIVRRFAAADPGNAGAKRDLAVSHGKLAANYHRLGKTGLALAELRKGRAILAALVEAAPEVEPWSIELARFEGRIDVLEGRAPAVAAAPVTVARASAKAAEPKPPGTTSDE